MRTYHKYTPKEIFYIKKKVNNNPTNITKALEEASSYLNISFDSACHLYYRRIAPYNKVGFTLFGFSRYYKGYKNNKRGDRPTRVKPIEIKESKGRKILKLIRETLKGKYSL